MGIDIERVKPCSQRLYQRVADLEEWGLAPEVSPTIFFRYWTAKEAVLKAGGVGLVGLSQCRILKIVDDSHLIIGYRNRHWRIEQVQFDDHIASVVQDNYTVQWVFA